MTGAIDISRSRGDRPIYVQLAERIAGDIQSGALRPGDRVASEPELVRLHGISRATAVRTLEHLEHQGLVRREQGRGTFVETPRLVQRSAQLGSFSDEVRRHGHEPSQRLLSIGAPATTDEDLGLDGRLGADVIEIRRLRLVDGEPVGLHATYLQRTTGERAGLTAEAFAGDRASLYELLDGAGVQIAEADEHLQAIGASRQEAELLGVAPGSALMRVVRISYGSAGDPIEVVDARYRADRFDYSVSLVRGHGTGRGGSTREKEHNDGRQGIEDSGDARRDRTRTGGGRVRQIG